MVDTGNTSKHSLDNKVDLVNTLYMASKLNPTISNKPSTIVTIVLLIFIFPLGWVVMWLWPRWPMKVKFIVTVAPIIFYVGLIYILGLFAK